ncbi:MAG: hypothetical protein V4587_00265 [Acidobacteriota bacterium]
MNKSKGDKKGGLPASIYHTKTGGYRVAIKRANKLVIDRRFSGEGALARAIKARDEAVLANPTVTKVPKSNTGHIGISEGVHWKGQRPLRCFAVSWNVAGRPFMKRVYYGRNRTRAQALKMAIAIRASFTGAEDSRKDAKTQR